MKKADDASCGWMGIEVVAVIKDNNNNNNNIVTNPDKTSTSTFIIFLSYIFKINLINTRY